MASVTATGTVSPGYNANPAPNNTGTLTTGNVTWDAASTFSVDLNPVTNDVLAVIGNIDLGGALLTGTATSGIAWVNRSPSSPIPERSRTRSSSLSDSRSST